MAYLSSCPPAVRSKIQMKSPYFLCLVKLLGKGRTYVLYCWKGKALIVYGYNGFWAHKQSKRYAFRNITLGAYTWTFRHRKKEFAWSLRDAKSLNQTE